MEGDDLSRIRQLSEQLQQASHALTQQLYQQQAAGTAQSTNGAGQAGAAGEQPGEEDDDVVEGEFRQV